MGTNQTQRVLHLLNDLRNCRQVQVTDLTARLGVSRRTVFRDLHTLKRAGVDLHFDRELAQYRVSPETVLPLDLKVEEAVGLLMLARRTASPELMPNYDAIQTAADKLEASLPVPVRSACRRAIDYVHFRHPPMTDARRCRGIFEFLLKAATEGRKVTITYDEQREHYLCIRPCRLVFLPGGWRVLAAVHGAAPRFFELERILSVSFDCNCEIPELRGGLKDFLGQAWSIHRGARRHHVRIRFSHQVGEDIEKVLWHSTQQTQTAPDGALLFEADVDGLDEICAWVLTFGPEAKVEEPAELRKLVRDQVSAVLPLYENEQ